MIWKHGILKILEELKINGNCLAFVQNFLSQRNIQVRYKEVLSNKIQTENGVPQGSVISVTLFLIAINDITANTVRPAKALLYADDLLITCSGTNTESIEEILQECLYNLQHWSNRTGFKFSATKSNHITSSRRRTTTTRNINFHLNNNTIQPVNTLKILGVIFDPKLTWKMHIDNLKTECHRRINILKALASINWGADREILLNSYRAIIRSKLDYGAIIYDSASPSITQKLAPIQTASLQIALGAFRSSPKHSILVEANETPLDLRRIELMIEYAMPQDSREKNPTALSTELTASEKEWLQIKPRLPKPFKVRLELGKKRINFTTPGIKKR